MSPRRGGGRWRAKQKGDSDAQTPSRYRMREKLLTFGNDFVVETAAGEKAFKVDGKALRVRNTIQLRDLREGGQYRIQERKVRLKDTMVIQRDGQRVATIQKALVTPLRDRLTVQVADGPPLKVMGNLLDHEYKIKRNGTLVATVSKRWFRIRDTYGVEVSPGEDDGFVLAVAAAIDCIAA